MQEPSNALQELDRIQGRGQSGAKSPLLWDEGQVEALLQGSPIVAEVAERLHVRPYSLFSNPIPSPYCQGSRLCACDGVMVGFSQVWARSLKWLQPCLPSAAARMRGVLIRACAGVCAQGIEREYGELDTVWFMAGSLFRNYPYDVPTEAFSLNLFRQARGLRVFRHQRAAAQGCMGAATSPISLLGITESHYLTCMLAAGDSTGWLQNAHAPMCWHANC